MSRITFRASAYEVKVPATSANLGPGFDCFALALEKRDRYIAQVIDEKELDLDVVGEGADEVPRDEKNLLVKSIYKGWEFLGLTKKEYPGVALRALNNLPHGRGLGSSASAIIGGLILARSLVVGGVDRMNDNDVLTGDINETPPEGSLLPDTYKFERGDSRQKILNLMRAKQREVLNQIWARRSPEVPVRCCPLSSP